MKKDIVFLSLAAGIFCAAIFVPDTEAPLPFLLYLAAFLLCGAPVLLSACKGIVRGDVFNENTLMVTAAIGAFCIREYPEAVFVMLFYRVGELFEDYAVRRSRQAISQVMNICPEYANLLLDGTLQKADPEEIHIGDILVVAPGERVPLDGVVIRGQSFVDTGALTGESVPRQVAEGDPILSGCINQNATLHIRVTKTFADSTVSRILELVETAAARKSSSERFITKFAKYYTPAVLSCALLLAVVPPLVIPGASFGDFIYRALSFLVVSCPCALVISVPLAFFGGIGGAARQGILIKGGNYLEALSHADTVVLDKTGTLTRGSFTVTHTEAVGMDGNSLLFYAVHAEAASVHPIAQSLRQAWGKPLEMDRVTDSRELTGMGVAALVDGKQVLAGNAALLEGAVPAQAPDSGTAVYVSVDGKYAGRLIISDTLKDDAAQGIRSLKAVGIRRTVMLTGDRAHTAQAVARTLGIDAVESELLPQQKVERLEAIMEAARGRTVYVGDGINDAPVLARADVGIAMGALGSDAAVEAADIVIMTDEVGKIATAVKIAGKTMSIAKQNIFFSVAIKLGILALCATNVVGMGIAVFGDVGVMVLAVLNSFRAQMAKQ